MKTKNKDNIYIGLSASKLKKRIAVHKTTIKSKPEEENYHKYVNSTGLSKKKNIN